MRALRLVLPTLAYNVSIGLGNLAMTLRIIGLGGNVGDVGLAAFVYNLFFALVSPIWPITLLSLNWAKARPRRQLYGRKRLHRSHKHRR